MFRRARYQQGSLQLVKRKAGKTAWEFRWYETQVDGTKKYRKVVVGSSKEFPTETEARNAVDALRLTINNQTSRQSLQPISMEVLVQHYREHEMPDVFFKGSPSVRQTGDAEGRKSYSTQDTYEGYLKKWILPRWRTHHLGDVKSVQVEQWLKTVPLARAAARLRSGTS